MEKGFVLTNNFIERQNRVKDIPSIPNTEALLLETELGVSFEGLLPKKVKLSESQATRIFSKKSIGTGPVKQAIVNFVSTISRKTSAAAEYFEEHDTLVVYDKGGKTDETEKTRRALHENMHGWMARQNEKFLSGPSERINTLIDEMPTLNADDESRILEIVEEYFLAKIISEGISNVGANYTGIMHNKEDKDARAAYIVDHLHYAYPKSEVSIIQEEDWGIFDFDEDAYISEAREIYKSRDTLVKAFKERNILKVTLGLTGATKGWYKLGYKLALMIAETGIEEGITVGEAFKRFVKKPNLKFGELLNLEEIEAPDKDR